MEARLVLICCILGVTFVHNVSGGAIAFDQQESRAKCVGSLGVNLCAEFPTGCYCIVKQQLSWTQARDFCKANQKKLLSVESLDKQKDLEANLAGLVGTGNIVNQVGAWTSGTYNTQSSRFVWDPTGEAGKGQPFSTSFSRWQFGSPKSPGPNNCVRIISRPTDISDWANLDCGQYLPFICESN